LSNVEPKYCLIQKVETKSGLNT